MIDTWKDITVSWINTGSIILMQPVQPTCVEGITFGLLLTQFCVKEQVYKIYESTFNSN